MRERFDTLGAEVWSSTPEQLGQFIKDDLAKWSKVVKTAGINADCHTVMNATQSSTCQRMNAGPCRGRRTG